MIKTENFDKVEIASQSELRDWLLAHHGQADSVWLVTWKKDAAPQKYVSRESVLDELVSFGWIDGIRRKLDEDRTMQLISPRKQQKWAQTYRERATRLIAEGKMHESGQRTIDTAKRNGLWNAMADVDALEVPDDLASALKARPPAIDYFAKCAPSYRRNILRWLATAKKPETRLKRIGAIVDACQQRQRIPNY